MTKLKKLENKLNDLGLELKYIENNYCINLFINEFDVLLNIFKGESSLKSLRVPKSLQGKKLGSLLVEVAKELGVTQLNAEANGTGLDQEQLVNFYTRHGFKTIVEYDTVAKMELI